MKKVSRSDQKYREIEKFEDYELTQCIAYEMAIRNQEVADLVEQRNLIGLLDDLNSTQLEELKQMNSDEKAKAFANSYLKDNPERITKLLSVLELDEKIKELSFYAIPAPDNDNTKLLEENLYFRRYLTSSSQRAQAEKSNIMDSNTLGYIFNNDSTVRTTAGGIIKYTDLFPKFSRPLPIIPTKTNKEVDLILNLALPTEELTALVEVIKKAYDKNNDDIFHVQTPLALATQIGNDIFTIQINIKKKGSNTNLEMPEKTQQEVYADLLFLYDVFSNSNIKKKGDKIQHFRNEMIDYYAKKVCIHHGIKDIDDVSYFIGTPRDQTIREYAKMMRSYIDDYGYKKLLV